MSAKESQYSLTPKTWGGFWDHFGAFLVDLLDIRPGARVLDVGSGGGASLYPAAKRVGPSGRVTGIETCEGCLKRTNDEIRRCGVTNAELLAVDGRTMTFSDASFDYVVAGFIGWDDYFDFDSCQVIAENTLMNQMLRVLKEGGSIGISSWLKQEDLDWMKRFLNSHSIDCRTNYCHETKKGWRFLSRSLGLRNVQFSTETFTYTYPTVTFWWKEMMDYNWVRDVENKDSIPEPVVSDALEAVQSHVTEDGGVVFSRSALFLTAKK